MSERKSFPLLSALGIWLLLAVFANINGAIRVFLIIPFTGEPMGHIISCFTFSAIIFFTSYFYIRGKNITNNNVLFMIGLLWLCATIVFEFIFGHFVMNHSWEKLLGDYDISAGRLWVVVLVATFLSPLAAGTVMKRKIKP